MLASSSWPARKVCGPDRCRGNRELHREFPAASWPRERLAVTRWPTSLAQGQPRVTPNGGASSAVWWPARPCQATGNGDLELLGGGSRRGIGHHGLAAILGDARQGALIGIFGERGIGQQRLAGIDGLGHGPGHGAIVHAAGGGRGGGFGLGQQAFGQIQSNEGPMRAAQKSDGQGAGCQQTDREGGGKSQRAPALGRDHAFRG